MAACHAVPIQPAHNCNFDLTPLPDATPVSPSTQSMADPAVSVSALEEVLVYIFHYISVFFLVFILVVFVSAIIITHFVKLNVYARRMASVPEVGMCPALSFTQRPIPARALAPDPCGVLHCSLGHSENAVDYGVH